MSEHSESQFTITFGQSNRVVKRSGRTLYNGTIGSGSVSQSKLSVKDRLGTIADDALEERRHHMFKRQRVEENQGFDRRDGSNDTSLEYADLRFKLMQKNLSTQFPVNDPPSNIDLRDKLSSKATLVPADGRRSRSPIATLGKRKTMMKSRDIYDSNLHNMVERGTYDDGRQGMREARRSYSVERQSKRDPRDTFRDSFDVERQRMREPRDRFNFERQGMREPRDRFRMQDPRGPTYEGVRQSTREPRDGYAFDRHSWREPRNSCYVGQRRSMHGARGSYNVGRRNMQDLGVQDTYNAGRRKLQEDPRDSYSGGRRSLQEDPRDSYYAGRQNIREPRDSSGIERRSIREPRDSYNFEGQSMQERRGGSYSVGRRNIRDPKDSWHSVQEPKHRYSYERRNMLHNKDYHNDYRRIRPSSNSGSDVPAVAHARSPYRSPGTVSEPSMSPEIGVPAAGRARKPYTSDDLRRRSVSESSMSPESDVEELQRKALIQTYHHGCAPNVYRRNEVSTPKRAVRPATLTEHHGINAVPHLPGNTISVTAAPRIPNHGEQFTVDGFLQSLHLEEYSGHFNDEEIDFPALMEMSDTELKELGIPMGPRKRILHALLSTR